MLALIVPPSKIGRVSAGPNDHGAVSELPCVFARLTEPEKGRPARGFGDADQRRGRGQRALGGDDVRALAQEIGRHRLDAQALGTRQRRLILRQRPAQRHFLYAGQRDERLDQYFAFGSLRQRRGARAGGGGFGQPSVRRRGETDPRRQLRQRVGALLGGGLFFVIRGLLDPAGAVVDVVGGDLGGERNARIVPVGFARGDQRIGRFGVAAGLAEEIEFPRDRVRRSRCGSRRCCCGNESDSLPWALAVTFGHSAASAPVRLARALSMAAVALASELLFCCAVVCSVVSTGSLELGPPVGKASELTCLASLPVVGQIQFRLPVIRVRSRSLRATGCREIQGWCVVPCSAPESKPQPYQLHHCVISQYKSN